LIRSLPIRTAFWITAVIATTAGGVAAQESAPPDRAAFGAVDANQDGFVDEAELARDMAKSFAALDANRDQALTPNELADHDAAQFRAVDGNGDGRLTFQEVMRAKLDDFFRAGADDGRLAVDEYVKSQGTF
jgi:hypothetical protein